MVAIRLVYFHISIRWYKIQILWLWMSSPKGKSFARALSISWPHAWMGIKIKILQYWGEFRIDSTEMEMMATLQNLSNNSMQAGLRAVRYICSVPRFPVVSPLASSWISAVNYPLFSSLFPKAPHSEHWILISDFPLQPLGIFPHFLQIVRTDSIHIN